MGATGLYTAPLSIIPIVTVPDGDVGDIGETPVYFEKKRGNVSRFVARMCLYSEMSQKCINNSHHINNKNYATDTRSDLYMRSAAGGHSGHHLLRLDQSHQQASPDTAQGT